MAPTRGSRASLFTFLLLLAAFLLLTVKMVLGYLLAIFMGGILALLFGPFYHRLRARRLGPKLAAGFTTLAILLCVIIPLAAFVLLAVRQAISVGEYLSDHDVLSFNRIVSILGDFPVVQSLVGSPEVVEQHLRNGIRAVTKGATGLIVALAAALPQLVLQLALASLACFFLLIDGRRFLRWIEGRIPLERDVRARLNASFRDTAISTIWATLAAAGAQALVVMLGFIILRVPAAVLAGGATFIFAWIPLVGSVPVWVAGTIYLWTQGSIAKAIVMVLVGFVAGLIDNFVRPLVLRGRGEMHPLVALVAIFGGIDMFGLVGAFIGPILAAVCIALLQAWPAVGRRDGIPVDGETVEPRRPAA